jgi:hypothetical protein
LTDAPHEYTDQAGKIVAVNVTEDGLEFIDPPTGDGGDSVLLDQTIPQTIINGNVSVDDPVDPAHIANKKYVDDKKLDDLATPDDNTDLDVSTSRHGLVPKAPNDTKKFLRGDGTWAQIASVFLLSLNLLTNLSSPSISDVTLDQKYASQDLLSNLSTVVSSA